MALQPNMLNEFENNILEEFLSEYNSSQLEIENLLLSLEHNPNDSELLNSLFRQVHNLKGNSHVLGLHVLTDFVHALESVLDKLRKNELVYNKDMGDVVLRAIDQIGNLFTITKQNYATSMDMVQTIQSELTSISTTPMSRVTDSSILYQCISNGESTNSTAHNNKIEDLKFFSGLIENAEKRSPLWQGRSQRILNIALELNNKAGLKVDPLQLEAATYLHDFGMAFLPLDVLDRSSKFSVHDHRTVKLHPNIGAALIADNPQWNEAAKIIVQHHEREDGKGYPYGLTGDQICDGAKILAVAGAIESIISRKTVDPYHQGKYPVTYAIREINKNAGTQFSPYWVSIFNQIIRHTH